MLQLNNFHKYSHDGVECTIRQQIKANLTYLNVGLILFGMLDAKQLEIVGNIVQ